MQGRNPSHLAPFMLTVSRSGHVFVKKGSQCGNLFRLSNLHHNGSRTEYLCRFSGAVAHISTFSLKNSLHLTGFSSGLGAALDLERLTMFSPVDSLAFADIMADILRL